MKKIFAFAVVCSMTVSSFSGIRCVYAESVEITCNVDGQSGVSNVGQGAIPLVTVNFSEDMDESTLDSSTIKIYRGDEEINYTPYSVSSDSYVIDLKNFSSLIKDKQSPQSYEPQATQDCRIELNGVKLADGTEAGDKSFKFSTSLVLPVSYIEGCTIDNVALDREVIELGTGVAAAGDLPEYATDGRQFNEWKVIRENVSQGNNALMIDLERPYKIAGAAIAGVNGAWYDRYQFIGGSNSDGITSGNDITKLVTGTIETAKWNQIVSGFFDYDKASRFRYIYAGSNTTCLACRELYVWAYIPDLVDVTVPENDAENVSNVGSNAITDVEINFFNKMDKATLNPDNIIITDENGNTWEYDEYTADEFMYKIPITVLKQNREYTVTVTRNVLTVDGVGDKEYQFSFKTSTISKGSKPIDEMIADTYPKDGDENVSGEKNGYLEIHFSDNMETSTVTDEYIKLYDEFGNQVIYNGAMYENNTYKIPIGLLESDSVYTIKVSGVVTEEGVESVGDYEFSFKTGTVVGTIDISGLYAGCSIEDNSSSVTNVGDDVYIDVLFNKKVDEDSLKKAVVILDNNGNELSSLNYVVSNKKCSIDKGGLTSDTDYTLVIYSDRISISGMTITGNNIEIPFRTGYILNQEAEQGTKIINISENRTVYSAKGETAGMIVDGNIANNYQIKDDTLLIDLGGYYEVISVKHTPTSHYDYTNGANWWHTNGIKFWIGNEKDFTLENFTNFYTTAAHESSVIMPVSGGSKFVRYIAITNPSKMAVIGEVEVYARIGVGYEAISGKISGDECNATLSVLNYSGENKTAYVIFCEYNSSDRLVAVNAKEIILDKEKNTINKSQKLNVDTSKVKVFVSTDIRSIDMQTDALSMSR